MAANAQTWRRVKREGWNSEGILVVKADDDRLSWPEREMIRQLGEKLTANAKQVGCAMVEKWTASLVEERLVEAADVLKRMPPVKVCGYFNVWPTIVHDFGDLVGQEPQRLKRPYPSAAAISRMEETLGWTVGLDAIDAKIVWL